MSKVLNSPPELETTAADDAALSTRRGLLVAGGALALAAITSQVAGQQSPGNMGRNVARFWTSPTNRLIRRITYGLTASESARAASMGFQAYLNEQLDWQSIDDSACENYIATNWPLTQSTQSFLSQTNLYGELLTAYNYETIYRAYASKRQLREKMFEFWTNHFNISHNKVAPKVNMGYLRDVLRANSMGTFKQILTAVANSGAMMWYLDNFVNGQANPNVNYAREIMELHTLGAGNGYTEADIYELARVLTGWGYNEDLNSPTYGTFQYHPWAHDPGSKTVMGRNYNNAGKNEADDFINFLADHPNTATFICTKLCAYFLDYAPSPATVSSVVEAWKTSGGDIPTVLRAILTPANLKLARPKLKRPFHYAISCLRVLPPNPSNLNFYQVWYFASGAGHTLYEWETPDGHPDRYDYWGPSMGNLLSFGLGLPVYTVANLYPDVDIQMGTASGSSATVYNNVLSQVFSNELSLLDKKEIYRFLSRTPTTWITRTATGLALASPSFIWY